MAREGLGLYGSWAKSHWKKYRPKMYAELERKGLLTKALLNAQRRTSDERADLIVNHGFQVFEADEVVLPKYVLFPAEDDVPALGEFNPLTVE